MNRLVVETRNGLPVRVLLDHGDGQERPFDVITVTKQFSSERRPLATIELRAVVEEREL